MSKIKQFLTALLILAIGLFAVPSLVIPAEASGDRIAVYVQLPGDWAEPYLWAWSDDGVNAFDAWPGGEMEADSGNEGWYYCWIPKEMTNIIVSANDASVQTSDHKIESRNAWVTVEDAETVTVSYDPQTQGDIPEYVETFQVHARVPEDWTEAGLWAWSAPDGKNAFDAWPGKTMKLDGNDWYTASAPVWVNSIIINGNGGAVQTEDISIDPAEIWVTVLADGTVDFTYNDPDAPVAEDITVYVKVPSDWSEPCLWAWSAPDGTNAFASWPGEALTDAGDGWMSLKVPGWINSVIVNGNGGSVQTQDLSVETGRDVWVQVTDPENAVVSYEKPEEALGEEQAPDEKDKESSGEESSQENEESASQEPDASKDPEVSKDAEVSKKSNVPLIAGIVVLAAVILGVGGFVWHKKKK